MTETREQWIEREAAAARKRWRVSGEWDSVQEHIRQDWRNVVAPYYQEPLRVPVDVDGLAKELCDAAHTSAPLFRLDWDETAFRDSYRAEARAALAYLNIDPCAKPEYEPADVALPKPYAGINGNCPEVFRDCEHWMAEGPGTKNIEAFLDKACDKEGRYNVQRLLYLIDKLADERRVKNDVALTPNERAELENLRAECKRLRHEVEVERDRANDLLAERDSVVNIRDKTIKAMREENAKLRVEASEATAKAERQRQQLHSQCKTIESRGAEIARLENEVKRMRTQRAEEKIGCHGCGVTLPKTALEIGYNPVVDGVRVAVCQRCWAAGVGLQGKTSPETRPVRVRFDVTPEELATKLNSPSYVPRNYVSLNQAEATISYLAARAVIEVPPGVPTYRELREIGVNAYLSHDSAKRENAGCMVDPMGSAAAAIRDAVLAGIQRREWTEEDVEELARLLRVAPDEWRPELDKTWHIVKDMYVWQARAALAWFDGKRGDV